MTGPTLDPPLFVMTGPPGSGKTALLAALRATGIACVDEPARAVIAQQRAVGGAGTSEQDPGLFVDLMLARAIDDHAGSAASGSAASGSAAGAAPVVFDRGIPDLFAYAGYYGLDSAPIAAAARQHRYNPTVFFAPAWPEIYTQDDERTMTFDAARQFGDAIFQAYVATGYRLVELPRAAVARRRDVVLAALQRSVP